MIRRHIKWSLLVLLVALPRVTLAWWDDAWAFRKPITLETTASGANVTEALDSFTVLIRLHVGNFGYFADTKPDGADIRFIAGDDKTPLPFHIESYDPTAGMAFIWVRVARLAAGSSQNLFMYYGNPGAVAASDPRGSWDAGTVLAYHFAGGQVSDQTASGNNPSASSAVPNPGSVIGAGVRFNGAERIAIGATQSLRLLPSQGLTMSGWINIDQEQPDALVVDAVDPAGPAFSLAIDGLTPYLRVTDGLAIVETPRTTRLTPGSWHQLTFSLGTDQVVLYLDGQRIAEVAGSVPEVAGQFAIGGGVAGDRLFFGSLDELVVDKVVRPAGWVQARFANQGQTDLLVRYGEDTQRDAGEEPSYFLITLQNVTVDGWAVIVVLALMAIISWVVMITKWLTIRRVRHENSQFLQDFRKTTTGNMAALDRDDDETSAEEQEYPILAALSGSHDHYQSATLYHLYHVGIQEVKHRFASAAGADRARSLSSQAMDAIRATVDAANVRETQKLNSQMVLLTLAIAGGPFLGLLGTVVGVMITFAVIAATGDVNVNSIAPGIAAALAATVAGLAVAIPALFGYNYLAAQIKEVIADDRVFIDEFVSKLAEQYS